MPRIAPAVGGGGCSGPAAPSPPQAPATLPNAADPATALTALTKARLLTSPVSGTVSRRRIRSFTTDLRLATGSDVGHFCPEPNLDTSVLATSFRKVFRTGTCGGHLSRTREVKQAVIGGQHADFWMLNCVQNVRGDPLPVKQLSIAHSALWISLTESLRS